MDFSDTAFGPRTVRLYGRKDFSALRAAIKGAPHPLLFYAFDLVYLDGFDIRGAPLVDRRKVLAAAA